MNKYKVTGQYTISFTAEIIADSEEEAIEIAEDFNMSEGCDGSIFCYDPETEVTLSADGCIFDVEAELLETNVEDDDHY